MGYLYGFVYLAPILALKILSIAEDIYCRGYVRAESQQTLFLFGIEITFFSMYQFEQQLDILNISNIY